MGQSHVSFERLLLTMSQDAVLSGSLTMPNSMRDLLIFQLA